MNRTTSWSRRSGSPMYFTLMLHLRSVPSLGLMNRIDMIEYIVKENFVNLQHFLEDRSQVDGK